MRCDDDCGSCDRGGGVERNSVGYLIVTKIEEKDLNLYLLWNDISKCEKCRIGGDDGGYGDGGGYGNYSGRGYGYCESEGDCVGNSSDRGYGSAGGHEELCCSNKTELLRKHMNKHRNDITRGHGF